MATRKPGVNEKRKTEQPFKIDKLPAEVREAIEALYTKAGRTWQQIEEQSARKYDPNWRTTGGGFVNWDDLPTSTLELFPDLKLPLSTLHRWYKVRIAQVANATRERAEYARQLAESFVGARVEGDKDAVLHAARDIFFGILSEDPTPTARAAAGEALLELSKQQQRARTNDIRERQVGVEEKRVRALLRRERLQRMKLERETEHAAKKLQTGELTVADINRIRERTFGLPPLPVQGT